MRTTRNNHQAAMLEHLEQRALLATFVVTTTDDSGAGSLRQAIGDANDLAGADVIEFDPSLAGSTITLSSGRLDIRDALSISGAGPGGSSLGIAIDADSGSSHFLIDDGAAGSADVSISDLTLINGSGTEDSPGSIYNGETLVLERVTMLRNHADRHGGAIRSAGDLTVRDSSFGQNSASEFGGTILFVGLALTIEDCTFSQSSAGASGGAIYFADGTLIIRNSNFSGSSSGGRGGSIYSAGAALVIDGSMFSQSSSDDDGGAIHTRDSTATISASELSDNAAGSSGGAIHASGPILQLTDTNLFRNTAAANGGAIYQTGGSLTIEGGLMQSGSAANGGGIYNFDGALSITEAAISGNSASSHGGAIYSDFDTDVTLLRSIVSGNDAGSAGGGIYTSGGLTMTEGTMIGNTAGGSGGAVRAIGPQPVSIASSLFRGNASGDDGGALALYGAMNIEIDGSTLLGNGAARVGGGLAILNNAGATVTITDSTFESNNADAHGGGLDSQSEVTMTISGSTFTDNAAGAEGSSEIDGGGIRFLAGTLTVENATIDNNLARGDGGGVYTSGDIHIASSTISENSSEISGGGIAFHGEMLSIADSTISGNAAERGGGGLSAGGTVEHQILRTTIASNTAVYGGGIRLGADGLGNVPFRLDSSTVSGNTATERGGGIYYDYGALSMSNSTISGNAAGRTGGGISQHHAAGARAFANSTIAFNTVTDENGQGGGIFIGGSGFTLTSTIVAGNTHEFGGSTPDDITAEFEHYTVNADSSFNLIGDADADGGMTHGGNNNLLGLDPLLGPLADNGGPTLTHALMEGSPAIDAGAAFSSVQTDQRGGVYERSVGAQPDIGAFEFAPYSLRAAEAGATSTTSLADGTHLSVIRNAEGDLVVFEGSGSDWTALRFADYTNAPDPIADPIIWTDPNDGLAYVAAPADGAFLLFRRADNGTWSYRDLAGETASGSDAPTDTLAFFVTRPRTGSPLVTVAGINDAGEIVAYQQTSAAGNTQASWSIYNISDDLDSQGMTTPAFTKMTSYVTSWNQWTLAGLDADGNVQGVWVNVATFTTWRVDNLSTITGASPLTGELDVTLTTWGGIRFAGANASGRIVATWWNPVLGPGNWRQTDLTAAVQGGADALTGGQLTAWFTPADQISYAGYNADGNVVSFYWEPGDGGVWSTDNLTEGVADEDRPVGTLTSHVSSGGEVSLSASSANSDVLRLWTMPETRDFTLDILSDLAVRI